MLLTTDDRTRALENVSQLASLSCLATSVGNWLPSGLSQLAVCCADACQSNKSHKSLRKEYFQSFSMGDFSKCNNVLVVNTIESSDAIDSICAVGDILGAGGYQLLNTEEFCHFVTTLKDARNILATFPEFQDIICLNTGLIVPFLCKTPAMGSGSALQVPGALLLPAGVPAVVLAECWIHEALHTELYLAEWLEGKPPASAPMDLPTPWRTVNRPPSLLLHGTFVFSFLLNFIIKMSKSYKQIPSEWRLSATKGIQIAINNIDEVLAFRKNQICEALDCLQGCAFFTEYGKKSLKLSRHQLSLYEIGARSALANSCSQHHNHKY